MKTNMKNSGKAEIKQHSIKTLTKNEKKILSMLIDNAKISDSQIATRIKITPQGVRKIRKKLEENYITEYRTIINYDLLGIKVFAIVQMKIHNNSILTEKNNTNIIGAFEINEEGVTHVIILGFCSLEELDRYKRKIRNDGEIKQISVLSKEGFLKNSPVSLIKRQLKP